MTTKTKRVLTYLALAVVAYAIAMVAGAGPAFVVFLAGGIVAELLFWVELFRRRTPPSSS